MDSAGFDVCARLPFGKAHSIMERIFGWTITMATNTPFRQDCYPQEKRNHHEYDGCSSDHNPVTSI